MTTLSVVIPAYNEQEGITDIVHRVLAIKSDLAQVGVRVYLVAVCSTHH
jgi:glycosyltransferase involved in cell wall biosynthesis